ncbi:histidine kinase [Streptomyces sp. NPDC047315]|uniref:sensor histidine kinase n=1 Tax=Streptomyces sp. NPDC047315 TaxID=3155142 RepID=UPI0033F0C3C5
MEPKPPKPSKGDTAHWSPPSSAPGRTAARRSGAAGSGGRLGGVLTAVSRDPLSTPHRTRNDAIITAVIAVAAVAAAFLAGEERRPDALGWTLLAGAILPLVWRRSHPYAVLAVGVLCVAPYHALDNAHGAPMAGSMLAVYTFASLVRPLHAVLVGGAVVGLTLTTMFTVGAHEGLESLRTSGWIIVFLVVGMDVRIYRQYVASMVARAEHAERTREEEAARRVAEERIRIARDLHDLLAHSITLIGVQTSVASHVLTVDPDRLDRAAIAKALDDIADTCRAARGELRTTLTVLRTDATGTHGRADAGTPSGPLPELASLPELTAASGARLTLRPGADRLPPAAEVAAYRIVQESLTNAVRHGGTGVGIDVSVERRGDALHVAVLDDGAGEPLPAATPGQAPGFGIVGMRERARSVGGTLLARPRPDGGFEVLAVLPLRQPEPAA